MAMADSEQRLHEFILALEEERRKIQMFSRELPLCLQLVNEAIARLRQRMKNDAVSGERSAMENEASICKLDWLRSAQLCTGAADELQTEGGTLRKPVAVNARRVGRAFQPFEWNKLTLAVQPTPTAPEVSSTIEERQDDGEHKEKEVAEGQSQATEQYNRKQRRCWSPDLHRKFLNALEQLGGFHAATPKQIRDIMKVDGLTNDEVKSHLQKYRLHMRRPVVSVQRCGINTTQNQQQFVLLGSIWPPPHEYSGTVAGGTAPPAEGSSDVLNGTYSPPSLPLELRLQEDQPNKNLQTYNPPVMSSNSQPRCSQDDDSLVDDATTLSNSSSTSFSSQTTSISPHL